MINDFLKDKDAILVSSLPNIIYLTKDFGFSENEREALLLITKKNRYIITDKRYSRSIKNSKINYELIETGALSFLNKDIEEIIKKEKIKTLGIEEDNLTIQEYKLLKGKTKLLSINLDDLRIIKTLKEINKIKKACLITDEVFNFIIKELKIGISEIEISKQIQNFIKSRDADISFKPIVAFGKNSAIPHHLSGRTKLKKNQIVLFDFGVKYNNYCSDMSRTIFFGKADKKFKDVYTTVLNSQEKAIKAINLPQNGDEIDKVARDFITSNGFPSIPHALGHGVGLEVHESPTISTRPSVEIQNSMVFSIEPGIYLENWGGIRIEDLVLIKNNKAQLIYSSPREIIEVHDQ